MVKYNNDVLCIVGQVAQVCQHKNVECICVQKDTNSAAAIIKILQSADAPDDEQCTSPTREISTGNSDVGANEGLIESTDDLLKELSFLENQTVEEDNGGEENEVGKCLPLWENVSNTNQEPESDRGKGDAGRSEIAEGKEQEGLEEVKTLGASRRISMNTRSRNK